MKKRMVSLLLACCLVLALLSVQALAFSDVSRGAWYADAVRYVEENGGANFVFVTKDGALVIPKSTSILPSITRRSLIQVAEEVLGLEVTERPVEIAELPNFVEAGLCGTAAVVSPIGKIVDHGKEICFASGMKKMGPVLQKLYDQLTGMQMGTIEAPEGWIRRIV